MATPEEILRLSMAPLAKSVSEYGQSQVDMARWQAQRRMQLEDQAVRHQQALEILGIQQAGAKEREQATMDRGMAFLDERALLGDVGDVETRNRDRDSLYETAAAYGFKIDPKATPDANQRKASQVLEGKAVEGYKNLIAERTKIKDEIDELLTPKTVSEAELVKSLVKDPVVAGVLDGKQLKALAAGQLSLDAVAGKLSGTKREALLSQMEVVRAKLEEQLNLEQQRKAMVRGNELKNRHDELSTAISAVQKSIPAHRLGEVFTSGKDSAGTSGKGKGGGKEAFAKELKALLGGTPMIAAPISATNGMTPPLPPSLSSPTLDADVSALLMLNPNVQIPPGPQVPGPRETIFDDRDVAALLGYNEGIFKRDPKTVAERKVRSGVNEIPWYQSRINLNPRTSDEYTTAAAMALRLKRMKEQQQKLEHALQQERYLNPW